MRRWAPVVQDYGAVRRRLTFKILDLTLSCALREITDGGGAST